MKTVFHALRTLTENHQACMLISAVGGSGSVPRKTRAHMLVTESGRLCGTVGGGAVEGKAIELAQRLLEEGQSCTQLFVLHANDAQNLGMVCGGKVTLHFQYVSPENQAYCALAERTDELFAMGRRSWLIIGLEAGSLSVFDGDAFVGDAASPEVVSCLGTAAGQVDVRGKPYYVEPLVSSGKTYIFGGGHVAQALVPILASVDFRCVVLEDRAEFANPALFPLADEVMLIPEDSWGEGLNITEEDCICIMTRGHKKDLVCQAFALRTNAYYIGVIGSRKKAAISNERLRNMGFKDAEITRMHTPIGLAIGAQTPAEIAVSIAAEMIQYRAMRYGV